MVKRRRECVGEVRRGEVLNATKFGQVVWPRARPLCSRDLERMNTVSPRLAPALGAR